MRRVPATSPLVRLIAGALGVGAILAAAPSCGSRGPLDDEASSAGADASADVNGGGASVDGSSTTPVTDASKPDASPADAGKEGGTIIDCAQCLVQECQSSIVACVQSASCRQTFQCVITDCLSGGSPNPACLLQCASGDPKGALQVFQVFQCVTGTCGPDCSTLLGTILGALGGGAKDAGAPKADAGKKPIPKIAAAFSAWPELYTPAFRAEIAEQSGE